MQAQPVRAGSVIARRYRATRRIACGAMGEVWEGVHVELGHRVAIKVLRQEGLGSREMLVRFAREAFLLARIESEHVVRVIDFVPRGRHGPVLVMELLDGPTFAEELGDGRASLEDTVDVAVDVLRGLRAMHARNVIHRDVKPGNVILRRLHDGSRRAVLIDLGVGRVLEDEDKPEITTADRVVGTFEYMPPEQIVSCQTAGPPADVYAVGAMIFRAVTGKHAFGEMRGLDLVREKVRRPMPKFRSGRRDPAAKKLEAIVERAVAFTPRERWQSADEMLEALEALRAEMHGDRAEFAPAPESVATAGRPRARQHRRRRNTAIAIAAVCATAIAAWSTGLVRRAPAAAAPQTIGAAVTAAQR